MLACYCYYSFSCCTYGCFHVVSMNGLRVLGTQEEGRAPKASNRLKATETRLYGSVATVNNHPYSITLLTEYHHFTFTLSLFYNSDFITGIRAPYGTRQQARRHSLPPPNYKHCRKFELLPPQRFVGPSRVTLAKLPVCIGREIPRRSHRPRKMANCSCGMPIRRINSRAFL